MHSLDHLDVSLRPYVELLSNVASSDGDESLAAEVEFLQGQSQWVAYYNQLLGHFIERGECVYTDVFGDEITFTSIEEWINAFAVGLLDPLAERLSELELEHHRVGPANYSDIVADCYRILLTKSVQKVLEPLGFEVTNTFPRISDGEQLTPVAGTMKVAGREATAGLDGFVVRTRVVGLVRERRVYRFAEVITG